MLKEHSNQVRLGENGEIRYQADPSNPLPGVPVAVLKKGPSALRPEIELLEALALLPDNDKAEIKEQIRVWLMTHISTVLEPLVALESDETLQGAVQEIAAQVFDGMGIVPRENVQSLISGIDPEGRKVLRGKKIRLGPVLVFQPDLTKPAAVRLRALLWSVYNGGAMPAVVPHDGAVSLKIDPATADKNYYQSIGYPVYANRAIRIDMLDRVINSIYDSAKEGKFQAQHKMAEWLGCPIGDLYDILLAMGHTKISDPADQKTESAAESPVAAEAKAEEPKAEEPKPEEVKAAEPPAEEPKTEEVKAEVPAEGAAPVAPAIQVRPELATFRLKKGRAFEKKQERAPRPPRKERAKDGQPDRKKDDRKKDDRKDFKKGRKPERKDRDRKGYDDREPRIVSSTGPKLENSAFAILEQFRAKKDAG